jgi:hypothetical protein
LTRGFEEKVLDVEALACLCGWFRGSAGLLCEKLISATRFRSPSGNFKCIQLKYKHIQMKEEVMKEEARIPFGIILHLFLTSSRHIYSQTPSPSKYG